jgi:hypothetical protein
MLFFIKEMSEIPVVPAEAGTHAEVLKTLSMGSRLRGNDGY